MTAYGFLFVFCIVENFCNKIKNNEEKKKENSTELQKTNEDADIITEIKSVWLKKKFSKA